MVASTSSGRVVSPENVLEFAGVSPHKPFIRDPYHGAGEKRVTIWNKRDKRKLSGNSAPFRKNLPEYCRKHPEWEEYCGQDKDDYVPGVCKPQLTPRASAPPSEPRRDREPRRTTQRRSLRSEEVLPAHGRRARRGEEQDTDLDDVLSPRAHERRPGLDAKKGLWPADALTLEDAPFAPQHVPSEAELAEKRSLWLAERAIKMASEAECSVEDDDDDEALKEEEEAAPVEAVLPVFGVQEAANTQKAELDDVSREKQEWAAAKVKCTEIRLERIKQQQEIEQELSKKRQAEHEVQQLHMIELCEKRLQHFKRKRTKGNPNQ